MATNPLIIKDDRTGRTYQMSVYFDEHREVSMRKLRERMDYDYFESLPAEIRASKKKIDLDFTCPYCLVKTGVSSRKDKITQGFLFFIRTILVDVFHCNKCDKEFLAEDLQKAKDSHYRENILIENFENWKDAKRDGKNPPEFMSIGKVDEYIISDFIYTK